MTLELKANLAHYGAPPTWNWLFLDIQYPLHGKPRYHMCGMSLISHYNPKNTKHFRFVLIKILGKKHYFICHNYSLVKSLLLIANVYYFGRWEKDRNPSGCFFPPATRRVSPWVMIDTSTMNPKATYCWSKPNLVGGLEHEFYVFPYIGNVIIPTDELHHFSEG